MRLSTISSLLACALLVPVASGAQSLGAVAKKERERREKNKQEGVTVLEFSAEEVFGAESEGEESDEETAPEEARNAGLPGEPAAVSGEESHRLDTESRDRRRSEAEWRTRAQNARARIASARERVEILEGLSLSHGERYVDVHGNTVVESLEHLRRLVREAQEELASAELSWKELQEEARRASVPPGWLR